ncbi:hypothetical protein BC831DRAFT_404885 [Entophlyctis helioformis]|nr:hypothetical protein BC831DRAFT_404885 [Entophlyctis helioformis]
MTDIAPGGGGGPSSAPAPAPAASTSQSKAAATASSAAGAGAGAAAGAAIPAGSVRLKLLLVSGKTSELVVDGTATIDAVCRSIFDAWPKEWEGETVPLAPENLKILLRGRFLERPSTLASNGVAIGETTVVHVLIKNDVAPAGTIASLSAASLALAFVG